MKNLFLFGAKCSFSIGQNYLILAIISFLILLVSWMKSPEYVLGSPDIAIPLIIFGFGHHGTGKKTTLAVSFLLVISAFAISIYRISSEMNLAIAEKIYGYLILFASLWYFASIFTVRYAKIKKKRNSAYLLNLNEDNILEEAITSYGVSGSNSLYKSAANIEGIHKNLYLRLLEYFDSEKPYLRWDLSIYDVAKALYTNKVYISKAISVYTGSHFCQFVNYHRIKYSIELFSKDTTLKIAELSARSGFKSTTSYLSSFKSFMHKNPSEWMKDIRKNNAEQTIMRHTHS